MRYAPFLDAALVSCIQDVATVATFPLFGRLLKKRSDQAGIARSIAARKISLYSKYLTPCQNDLLSAYADGACRTGRNTGTATSAATTVKYRSGNAARLEHKTNCSGLALVAADAAFDFSLRQALFSDRGQGVPGRLSLDALEGTAFARSSAITAEGAFPCRKIHRRITGVVAGDDMRRAGLHAVSAACAGAQEVVLNQRPRRTQRALVGGEAAAQEIAAAGWIGHVANPCSETSYKMRPAALRSPPTAFCKTHVVWRVPLWQGIYRARARKKLTWVKEALFTIRHSSYGTNSGLSESSLSVIRPETEMPAQ